MHGSLLQYLSWYHAKCVQIGIALKIQTMICIQKSNKLDIEVELSITVCASASRALAYKMVIKMLWFKT